MSVIDFFYKKCFYVHWFYLVVIDILLDVQNMLATNWATPGWQIGKNLATPGWQIGNNLATPGWQIGNNLATPGWQIGNNLAHQKYVLRCCGFHCCDVKVNGNAWGM